MNKPVLAIHYTIITAPTLNVLIHFLFPQYDRAIIDFGFITRTAGAMRGLDEMIIIEWDAIVIDNPAIVDGNVYWVSVGAEYLETTEVWLGQASFVLHKTIPVSIFHDTLSSYVGTIVLMQQLCEYSYHKDILK